MAWTTPLTWTVGQLVTASNLNTHLRDNLNIIYPTYGTTLPGSASNGQQCVVTNPAGTGEMWHFRYNTGLSDAYKWQFIGGAAFPGPSTNISHANVTTFTGAAATNLVVPFGGEYEVILVSNYGSAASSSRAAYTVGAAGVYSSTYETQVLGPTMPALYFSTIRTLTAGATLTVGYRVIDGSVSFSIYGVHIRLRPVRVG